MKGTPYLNPDPFCRFIGPRNWGEALIDDKLTTCLLDNGSQLNFVTPTYARERGMDILSLDTLAREIGGQLPPIAVIGGGMIKPEGFVIMNVRVPCVKGYNEDQIAIVLEDPEMKDCPVVLGTGSGRVPVVLRNNTKDWLEIKKGTPIARMVCANLVPRVINAISAKGPDPASTLTEAERQDLLLDKLDLSGLEEWPTEQAEKARSLLKEYHDIFFLEKQDMGHTKAAEHKIVLKDPDTPPFKERFRRIPPPQLDEV